MTRIFLSDFSDNKLFKVEQDTTPIKRVVALTVQTADLKGSYRGYNIQLRLWYEVPSAPRERVLFTSLNKTSLKRK